MKTEYTFEPIPFDRFKVRTFSTLEECENYAKAIGKCGVIIRATFDGNGELVSDVIVRRF